MHEDAIDPGERILIVDDLIATGGTAEAAAKLIKRSGGEIVGATFVIDLPGARRRQTTCRARHQVPRADGIRRALGTGEGAPARDGAGNGAAWETASYTADPSDV